MRSIHLLPLAAAVLLTACGGGSDTRDSEPDRADAAAGDAADVARLEPGLYRATFELLEFEAPDLPEAGRARAEQIFTSGLTEHDYCLTPQDIAENGPRKLVENVAEGGCTMSRFNVSGSKIVATLRCPGEAGNPRDVGIEGQMTAEGSTMTMVSDQVLPGVGQVSLKTQVTSERIGDCPSDVPDLSPSG